jgi:MSHA biogenesis protein MshP
MVVAIFLLVVLAMLGAFIANITSSQHIGGAYDVQGARAYQAARYGSEWGVYQVLRGACGGGDYCAGCRAATYDAPHSQGLNGLIDPLAAFTVTVSCGSGAITHTEGADVVRVYQITATACNQPDGGVCPNTTAAAAASIGYIERRISLTVTN